MTQEYPCGSFGVFMDFPSARKVLTCKEIKTSGRARNSRSWDNSHSIGGRREVWWNKPRQSFSRVTQVDIEVPCTHRFSINILRSLCDCPEREVKYFSHFTGFKSYKRFRMVLEFFLPYLNRTYVVSWDSKGTKQVRIEPNSLFDSDTEIGESPSESSDQEDPVTNDRKYYSNLSVEDDLL